MTAEELHEAFTTPLPAGEINGPEVHANVVDAMLADRSIVRSPAWMTVVVVAIGAAGIGIGGLFLNAWLTGVVALVLLAVIVVAASWLFAGGVWVPITVPALAIVFPFVGDLAWKYFVEGRDKRLIKKLFSRCVSRDVFHQLIANPSLAELRGARQFPALTRCRCRVR